MQRTLKIFFLLVIVMIPSFLNAQNLFHQPLHMHQVIGNQPVEQKRWIYKNSPLLLNYKSSNLFLPPFTITQMAKEPLSINNNRISLSTTYQLPQQFYMQSLGFMCIQEIKFQQYTSLPLRFRLGSMEYVNYLEKKPNALKPN